MDPMMPNSNMGGVMPSGDQMPPADAEKKSGSLMWSILAVVILAFILFAVVKLSGGNKIAPADEANMQLENSDVTGADFGPQSDSDSVADLDAELDASDFGSLDEELP